MILVCRYYILYLQNLYDKNIVKLSRVCVDMNTGIMQGRSEGVEELKKLELKTYPDTDILITVPTKNVEDTVKNVVETADRGLTLYFPNKKSLIVIVDGFSTDATRENADAAQTKTDKIFVEQFFGPGKGNGIKTSLLIAREVGASAYAMVDGDLVSVQPEWIDLLISPIYKDFDLVVPYYHRAKYDGVITNQLAYPLTRALYGVEVRQPIGGEFGMSRELFLKLLTHPLFPGTFGIDIFITTVSACEGMCIVEADLGVKVHESTKKYTNPEETLVPMIRQVVGMMFELSKYYRDKIEAISVAESEPRTIERISPPGEQVKEPSDVAADKDALISAFKEKYHAKATYDKVPMSDELREKLESITEEEQAAFRFPSDLWAKIVYDFAIAYNTDKEVLDTLSILLQGRFASFVVETESLTNEEAEKIVKDQVQLFEQYRSLLFSKTGIGIAFQKLYLRKLEEKYGTKLRVKRSERIGDDSMVQAFNALFNKNRGMDKIKENVTCDLEFS